MWILAGNGHGLVVMEGKGAGEGTQTPVGAGMWLVPK